MSTEESKPMLRAQDRGQTVLFTPTRSRNRSEASLATTLCLLFRLSPSEGRVLAKLVTHDHCSKDELRTVMGRSNQTAALGTLAVIVHTLRAKLRLHEI